MTLLLERISAQDFNRKVRPPVDAETLAAAALIVADVRERGEVALRDHAERLGDVQPGGPLVYDRPALEAALASLDAESRAVLERTATRVRAFAEAQVACLTPLEISIPGGVAGHQIAPVERAGCYAPGGRFPLPSSVLMTAVTARAAGVREVWVASPKPAPATLAAAAIAGADALLAVGGAQAISALAYGAGAVPACDAVVGPGNRWVTAAKQLVAGQVAIDMLAGPSELLIIADASADPVVVAGDLLAQAEHDDDALPILVSLDEALIDAVERELSSQLETLPTAPTARNALRNGFAVLASNEDEAVAIANAVAPEHLQVMTSAPETLAKRLEHWGGLFIGSVSAEVLGDYGAGPNHTLPTGTTARFSGGLSVFNFLRVRTWMRIDRPEEAGELMTDAVALGRIEGLEAHARAAERRLKKAGEN